MHATATIGIRQTLPASLLIAVWLVLALGSRCHAFHQWVHGDSVHCVLEHAATGCEHSHPDDASDSQEKDSPVPDPLQPFCQTGIECQLFTVEISPEVGSADELPSLQPGCFHPRSVASSTPPRAPPNLV